MTRDEVIEYFRNNPNFTEDKSYKYPRFINYCEDIEINVICFPSQLKYIDILMGKFYKILDSYRNYDYRWIKVDDDKIYYEIF